MGSIVTVAWTDPAVGPGQKPLAALNVYAALDTGGSAGPLVLVGSVQPGVQTYQVPPESLQAGQSYYFTVKALDTSTPPIEGPQGNWAGSIGPVGAPGAPTNITATIG